jgi:hypothetical protein
VFVCRESGERVLGSSGDGRARENKNRREQEETGKSERENVCVGGIKLWFDDFLDVDDLLSRNIQSKAYTFGFSHIPEIDIPENYIESPFTTKAE